MAAVDKGSELAFIIAPGSKEGSRCWWLWACKLGEVAEGGDDDAAGEVGEEGRDAQALGGNAVSVGAGDALDETLQA